MAYRQAVMGEYLEIRKPDGIELRALEGDRVTLGKAPAADVCMPWDGTLSRLHAVLERLGPGWSLRDVGSRNGTFVNGERIMTERLLRPGDEIRMGSVRLVYRGQGVVAEMSSTQTAEAAPDLTRRERETLLSLCRPVLSGAMFTEPATIRDIAEELVVTEAAVKKHLTHLYDKFGIHEGEGERRRVRLANEAIRRGAVTVADLRAKASAEADPDRWRR